MNEAVSEDSTTGEEIIGSAAATREAAKKARVTNSIVVVVYRKDYETNEVYIVLETTTCVVCNCHENYFATACRVHGVLVNSHTRMSSQNNLEHHVCFQKYTAVLSQGSRFFLDRVTET